MTAGSTPGGPARWTLALPSLTSALAFFAGALLAMVLGSMVLCQDNRLLSAPATHHQAASRLTWHSAPALEAAEPAHQARYNRIRFNLTDAERRRGVGRVGSGLRLRRFAGKLMSGQPVKVLGIGGSVTAGHGLHSSDAAYPAHFGKLLKALFPHPETEVLNWAIGGTTASMFSLCFSQLVPQDVPLDLVVLELSCNEEKSAPFDSGSRKSYEQLLRKLLRLPSRPAVVVLHYYAWWFGFPKGGDPLNAGLYWESGETQLGVFDQYYDLPSLSLRSAIYHKLQEGEGTFTVDNVEFRIPGFGPPEKGEPAAPGTVFYHDAVHPSEFGHRIMAELLMELTWQAVTQAARSGRGPERAPLAAAPAAGEGSSSGKGASKQRSTAGVQVQQQGQDSGAADVGEEDDEGEEEELPAPMIPGNLDGGPSTCFLKGEFVRAVVSASGFAFVPHRPYAPTFEAQKWSWTGTAPGDWVEFEADTWENTTSSTAPAGSRNVTVGIGYLKSYESMGSAGVECLSGCTCDGGRMEGSWETRATLVQTCALQVTQHPKCRIRVTILPETSSGQHKISLTYLLVNPYYTGWFMGQWLGGGGAPGP